MSVLTINAKTEQPVSIFLEAIVAIVNRDTVETTVKQVCILFIYLFIYLFFFLLSGDKN